MYVLYIVEAGRNETALVGSYNHTKLVQFAKDQAGISEFTEVEFDIYSRDTELHHPVLDAEGCYYKIEWLDYI